MALIKTRARGLKLDDTFAFTGTVSGAGGGKVNQVITATKTNEFQTTSTSYATSGLEATITPTATSSKIFMIASTGAIHISTTSAGGETLARFYKNHASISATAIGNDYCVAKTRQDGSYNQEGGGAGTPHYLDSPSTTEAITYTVYLRINTGSAGRLGQNNTATTITLMEILA
tara:strand:+ start:1100 stop:1621 length:522 start_codon:yes stop_codon:yes gene_type:complete